MSKREKLGELITDNKENAEKLSAADIKVASEKDKIEKKISKLILANKENALTLSSAYKIINTQKKEIKKQAADLIRADKENAKRKADLINAKKELAHKAKLIILNKELTIQITERKQSEKALFESEERFRLLFNQAPLGYQALDFDGNFIDVNQQWLDTLGYTRDEVIGKWFGDFLSPAYQDGFRERFPIFKAQGQIHSEFEMVHKSGNILFIAFEGRIGYDTKGEFKQTHCILQDITERKKAEKTLQDIIDYNPMAIQILDAEGFNLKVNQAFMLLYGSIPPSDYSMFNDVQLIEKGFGESINHIKNGEVVHYPDMLFNPHDSVPEMPDSPVWVRTIVFPLVDGKGKPEKFVFMHENITEHKKAEENLQQSLIFNETLLNTIPFGMDIVDETGTVLFQSDTLKRILGKDVFGKKCWDIIHDDKKQNINCPLIKGIAIGETNTYESHGVLSDKIVEIIHTGMLYKGKKAILEIFQDITERKMKEQQLIKAMEKAEESDRLKSAFLTNMSHEIRTPMNGILGFAELLKDPNISSDDQQDFIQTIQISGARMLSTINSIVDVAKIESGLVKVEIKETNINEKIEFTYKFFKPEAEIKGLQFLVKTRLPSKEAIIETDNEKVYGILTNLVKNAIKFTYEGSIEFGYEKKGEFLEFFVKDTGIGIPKKQFQLIFERFRQGSESHNRGYEGSGLGLTIAKTYVEMLGGEIWVESEVGKGSTFYFTIPYNAVLEEKTEIKNTISAEHKEVQLKNLKILIVEDDEISYSLLTKMLQKISYEVLRAITGVQAIEACRNNPDLDLFLMDIRMPKMDGNEATRQIRQFNKDVIIIAQTAYGFSDDREKAIEAGCNDYISKPINMILLIGLILKHFNK